MGKKKTVVSNNGIGLGSLLGLLFVGLKLGGVISWSWWWVTVPFWGGAAIVIALLAVAAIIAGIINLLK